jgi:hypothetical protein
MRQLEFLRPAAQPSGLKRIARRLAAIFFICAALKPLPATAHPSWFFPLEEGNVWTYSARVRWSVANPDQERGASLQWSMRVLKSSRNARAAAAVVSGFLTDLAWYQPGKSPGLSVLVETDSGLFETSAASRQQAEELAQKAIAGEQVGDQLLRLPLRTGDCLNRDDPGRQDGMYCWLVQGRVQDPGGGAWELIYRSNPDTTVFHLVPGVGVTRYSYDHHGTVASADAQLVGFHRAARP